MYAEGVNLRAQGCYQIIYRLYSWWQGFCESQAVAEGRPCICEEETRLDWGQHAIHDH